MTKNMTHVHTIGVSPWFTFENSGAVMVRLLVPEQLTFIEHVDERHRWKCEAQEAEKAHRTNDRFKAFYDGPKIEVLSLSPETQRFLEWYNLHLQEIAPVFDAYGKSPLAGVAKWIEVEEGIEKSRWQRFQNSVLPEGQPTDGCAMSEITVSGWPIENEVKPDVVIQ